jgi:uncharacterized protein
MAQLGNEEIRTSVSLDEQVELLSLIGDVALKDGEPQVHAHVVIGKRDGTAYGGHLLQARVRPTCELVLTESPGAFEEGIRSRSGYCFHQAIALDERQPDSGSNANK